MLSEQMRAEDRVAWALANLPGEHIVIELRCIPTDKPVHVLDLRVLAEHVAGFPDVRLCLF